jgi:aspartate/methionine/tyrosine aminotransferase
MSKRFWSVAVRERSSAGRSLTPEFPGPPGLMSSDPMRAAGVRAGFYAGDPALVHYLSEVRKHVGLMVPGPVQAAAVAVWSDDHHVEAQRARYLERLELFRKVLASVGVDAPLPGGAFYLWAPAPDGDAWAFTERLAKEAGILVSPGEFYGPDGDGHVRVAVVQPTVRLEMGARRLRGAVLTR